VGISRLLGPNVVLVSSPTLPSLTGGFVNKGAFLTTTRQAVTIRRQKEADMYLKVKTAAGFIMYGPCSQIELLPHIDFPDVNKGVFDYTVGDVNFLKKPKVNIQFIDKGGRNEVITYSAFVMNENGKTITTI